jgi:hypothetical protein
MLFERYVERMEERYGRREIKRKGHRRWKVV